MPIDRFMVIIVKFYLLVFKLFEFKELNYN